MTGQDAGNKPHGHYEHVCWKGCDVFTNPNREFIAAKTGQDAGRRGEYRQAVRRLMRNYPASFANSIVLCDEMESVLVNLIVAIVDAVVAEAVKDRDARLAEAREDLLWACKHYDHWYMNGISGDAGTIAYDLVSHIRKALTRLRDPEAK